MPISISITRARVSNNRAFIEFSDGSIYSWASVRDFTGEHGDSVYGNIETLKAMALALVAFRVPNLDDPAQLEGRVLTLNPAIQNVLRIT